MAVHELSDADLEALSIVGKGANRNVFFLRKEARDHDLIEFPGPSTILKSGDEWETVYCVVAAPDTLEDPGLGAADQAIPDRWANEDEIRKAAHRFMANGALVNKMHESLEPYGELVENAVALADFVVDGTRITKGSWYVGIRPNDEGKAAIEKGEFTGVSIQGTAKRTLVDKADAVPTTFAIDGDLEDACRDVLASIQKAEQFTKPGTANVSAADRKKLKGLAEHYLSKPHPFTTCVRDQKKHGLTPDHAKRRCAVLLDSFDPKRKRHSTRKGSSSGAGRVDSVSDRLLKRIGRAVGLSDDDLDEIAKGTPPTFAERMAQRELDDELPDAMQELRSTIWRAFNPWPDDDDDHDPRALIETSLDEFKSWALALLDRIDGDSKVQKAVFDPDVAIVEAGDVDEYRKHVEKRVADLDIDVALPWAREPFSADDVVKRAVAAATGEPIEKGSKGDPATVEPVSDSKTDTDARLDEIEKTISELPDKIGEAIAKAQKPSDDGKGADVQKGSGGDGGEDGDEPTIADVSKRLDEAIEGITKLAADVETLGQGSPSDTPEGEQKVTKSADDTYREGILN